MIPVKPRWQLGLEAEATELRTIAQTRRHVAAADPAADALDFAAARLEARIRTLLAPTVLLTPAQYAAECEPPVDESTVRRWCARGELDCERDGKSYRIPAGAQRRRPPAALGTLAIAG